MTSLLTTPDVERRLATFGALFGGKGPDRFLVHTLRTLPSDQKDALRAYLWRLMPTLRSLPEGFSMPFVYPLSEVGVLLKDLETAFPRVEVFYASLPHVQDARDTLEEMLDHGVDLPARTLALSTSTVDMVHLYDRTLKMTARL